MKKLLFILLLSIGTNFSIYSQESYSFTFVKSSVQNLEKKASHNDDGMSGDLFKTPILKKRMLGMFLVNENGSFDYETSKYITFSSIPATEKFEIKEDVEYGSRDWEQNLSIYNVKTKEKYVVMIFPMRDLQDYNNMGNEANGNGWLTKTCPKELSAEKKALLIKYKALIKSADANIAVLNTIQKKYLTRGYFDTNRVNAVDKKLYNKTLDELKNKAEQLADIDRYDDKDNEVQNKLTLSESGSLYNINNWNVNQTKLY
ncbi:hypothetical protein [Flavobacterium sp. 14A]|uniref:hypothetical protein n=1 Tax=Flavobacterium sp. 14A TaxID=2735896 RepID=UPI00156E4CD6|nr:hypothetical protein [Flavobacterium sp. 14A]NRT13603.1 hypothetical protein [Flavobacterium sp. 14A]